VKGEAAKQVYSRDEVCRLLSVSERQLRSWETQGFVPAAETYGFSELIALRTLVSLKSSGVSTARMRQALAAIRGKLKDVSDPLKELKVFTDGRKIGVQVAGQRMEPVSGQLLFDFDADYLKRLLSFAPKPDKGEEARKQQNLRMKSEEWFQRGLELEQTGAPIEKAMEAYKEAIAGDPNAGGALVNLGTIYFKKRAWKEAEKHYLKALAVDSSYALAHFNLGNLYDETRRTEKALEHYQTALSLEPGYADAHYNIALLYQTTGHHMKAMRHWQTYLKLDPASAWAAIARRELNSLKQTRLVAANSQTD
jgi:tetratricopeptide (TPR) repeat protein